MRLKNVCGTALLSVALALGASEAIAQTVGGSDVVVTGERERVSREAKEVKQFVTAIAKPAQGQFARFRKPICPVAIGMRADLADQIAARVRAVAADIGGDVAAPRCAPNLYIIISPDGRGFVRDVERKRDSLLAGLSDGERATLLATPGPVHAWAGTELLNEDGLPSQVSANQGAGGADAFVDHPLMRVMSASIIFKPVRQEITTAVVVLDSAAVTGKSVTQIADYAAMRALGRTKPPTGTLPYETILTLFEPGNLATVAAMTPADRAFLSALYRSNGRYAAVVETGQIAHTMLKQGRAIRDEER
ncbi:MAG: hypothetical protein WC804_03545 [Sphingomonas sp.]|uniref:hypothetical protein n=1 Tax=Sphingomonas sp. TaxID=28214 RepID=UPI0035696F4F